MSKIDRYEIYNTVLVSDSNVAGRSAATAVTTLEARHTRSKTKAKSRKIAESHIKYVVWSGPQATLIQFRS
jgi:hypothetical protein